jgi:hypothetical protein
MSVAQRTMAALSNGFQGGIGIGYRHQVSASSAMQRLSLDLHDDGD